MSVTAFRHRQHDGYRNEIVNEAEITGHVAIVRQCTKSLILCQKGMPYLIPKTSFKILVVSSPNNGPLFS